MKRIFIVLLFAIQTLLAQVYHADQTGTSMHTPFRWIWADSAARVAQVTTKRDTTKLGFQRDDYSVWFLVDSLPTWNRVGTYKSDSLEVGKITADSIYTDALRSLRLYSPLADIDSLTDSLGISGNLYVANSGFIQAKFSTTSPSQAAGISLTPNVGRSYEIQASNANDFFVYDRTVTQYRLLIDSSGNVGIGNDSPVTKLDVTGAGTFSGTVTAPTFSGALSGNATTATTATNVSGGSVSATTGTFSGTVTAPQADIDSLIGNVIVGGSLSSYSVLNATAVNTGQGAFELYAMDQNVTTTSSPTFTTVAATGGSVYSYNASANGTYLALDKSVGALAVSPSTSYPVLKTDHIAMYFQANSKYLGYYGRVGSNNEFAVNDTSNIGSVILRSDSLSELKGGGLSVSGTVTAPTFSGALSGNATTATTATNVSGGSVNATTGTFTNDSFIQLTLQSTLLSGGIKLEPLSGRDYEIQASNDGQFFVYDRSINEYRFLIDSTGKAGIGTITPSHTLDVVGNAQFVSSGTSAGITITGDNGNIDRIQANGTNGQMYLEATDEIHIETSDYIDLDADTVIIQNGMRFGDGLGAGSFLSVYDTGSFPCTLSTSFVTVQQTGTIKWQRIGAQVTLMFPAISGTSTTTDMTLLCGSAPSDIAPTVENWKELIVQSNGSYVPGSVAINTTVTSFNFRAISSGAYDTYGFVDSGTKGIPYAASVTYLVN